MRLPVFLLCLAGVAAPAYSAPKSVPAKDPEKIICKKDLETGTLSRYTKTCLTRREWQRVHEVTAEAIDNLRNKGFSCEAPIVSNIQAANRPSGC